ncbi:E3 ubiquitin-protein ligase RING2-like [Tropilaelaps mercedesae]|uniref:RING-type E3 ubiquitin transferase n=1 Tax=Tropilaelaps mercedesae TaxID=418985 RepID=A0A1V9Y339_9ACAR|nr:E3 ubiquitin-protein ligase RING2-like [Tropilaelaps mercedesae]
MDPLGTARTWELSLYEMHRTPQEVCTDNTEIAVSQRSLHSELMCPICLDILKTTMTTKECLHRFCQECIITALRSGNKECPTCRKKLVSKRSLRADPNFDALIAKIYPSRDEYDHYQERVLAKLNKTCGQAFASSIEEGLKAQALSRKLANRKRPAGDRAAAEEEPPAASGHTPVQGTHNTPSPQQTSGAAAHNDGSVSDGGSSRSSTPQPPQRKRGRAVACPEDTDESSTDNVVTVNEIELVVKPHPTEPSQDTQIRYMKTTGNATAEHLAAYCTTRYELDASVSDAGNSHSAGGGGGKGQQTGTGSSGSSTPAVGANEAASGGTGADSKVVYHLYVSTGPASFLALPTNVTLDQINERYWKQNRPLELYYVARKLKDDSGK